MNKLITYLRKRVLFVEVFISELQKSSVNNRPLSFEYLNIPMIYPTIECSAAMSEVLVRALKLI